MKRTIQLIIGIIMVLMVLAVENGYGQSDERMNRDLKVAENVLATLIKQKFETKRMFFPLSVTSTYQKGYGVTFSIPADFTTPMIWAFPEAIEEPMIIEEEIIGVGSEDERGRVIITQRPERTDRQNWSLRDRRQINLDSVRDLSNDKLIEASKEFLADYGDILSQVSDNEKIIVTNKADQPKMWVNQLVNSPNRTHLSIEVTKTDLNQFKSGKLTRDQLMKKIKVVNAQAVDDVEPDLELLSTIFNRLYRQDLSKTYFTDGNIYYERLKNFGAVYYMQVYSANRNFNGAFDMPTIGLRNIGQEERDAKVKEIYPQFEQELKENIIEYGRTLKSLEDEESLVFNVRLTQCYQCGIPATVELTVKGDVLKNYNAGKIDRKSALSKISIKQGQKQ